MNIVYSASDLYSSLAGISITSVLMNNTAAEEIQIIMLDNGIGQANKAKLTATVEKYGRTIRFVPLTSILECVKFDMKRWNVATFGRLFEASSLPDLDKVIHIDCDTIVDGSLEELWNMDLENHVLAAAPDCVSDAYKTNIGMKPEDLYIQAGVILLNLKRIRQLELERDFASYIEKYGETLAFVDQEVINACVPQVEKKQFPLRFNSYSVLHLLPYGQVKKFKHVDHMVPRAEYDDAVSDAAICHYPWCALEGTRPWIQGDKHPRKDLFLRYKAQSEWADMELWADERKPMKKIVTTCVNLVPKAVLTPVVGYIHGVYMPGKNAKKRRLKEEK